MYTFMQKKKKNKPYLFLKLKLNSSTFPVFPLKTLGVE